MINSNNSHPLYVLYYYNIIVNNLYNTILPHFVYFFNFLQYIKCQQIRTIFPYLYLVEIRHQSSFAYIYHNKLDIYIFSEILVQGKSNVPFINQKTYYVNLMLLDTLPAPLTQSPDTAPPQFSPPVPGQ